MKCSKIIPGVLIGTIVSGGLAISFFTAPEPNESAQSRPNIIFILTDDQGYGDIARHGHPYLDTPNMDRMHDESVRFDYFYVSPTCSPTRAALMTGMHEFSNGVTHTIEPRESLYKEAVTLPQLLNSAGYKTGFIGKWHLGDKNGYGPAERGFEWCSTNRNGPFSHFDVEIVRNKKYFKTTGFREDVYFDEAMTFIDEAGEQPFFLYLATYSPHEPLNAPADLIAKYRAKGLNEKHAAFLAMVENLDQNLGRLTDFLKRRDLEKNTIVVMMNDNGATEGLDIYNAGMRGCKATIWEGGTRAFSFWKWPGHWKPHTVNDLTGHLDILPTLCEVAEADIPETLQSELQGFSLLPLLESKIRGHWKHVDRYLFQHVGRWPSGTAASHRHSLAAVRQRNYLLLHHTPCDDPECEKHESQCTTLRWVQKGMTSAMYTDGNAQFHWAASPMNHWALFNVKKDPACKKDLSAKLPERVSAMTAAYDEWWDEQFPTMMARGGDEGDPNESDEASVQVRFHD